MADGFEGFDERYRLETYDLNTIGKNLDGSGDANGVIEIIAGTWLNQDGHPSIAGFQPYKAANYPSKSGKIVRINNELYDELWSETDPDDVARKKKPAIIVVRHAGHKWWKPWTWDKTFLVHAVPKQAASTNYPNGKPKQYVSTIGFNPGMMNSVRKRLTDSQDTVLMSVRPQNTPLWAYFLCHHPSDAINLSVIFLYISTIIALIFSLAGEGYHWSAHFRHAMDWCDRWIRSRLG
jgi:hypothetical protein